MRSISLFITVLLCSFLFSAAAHAANFYVTQDGAGRKDGADWNNAFAKLPSDGFDASASWAVSTHLQRGSTYFIAGGTYPHYGFDDIESGAEWIRIVKATQSNSGGVAGWASLTETQRSGQTNFGYLYFRRDYYELDGQVRDEANWADSSKYGFRISMANPTWDSYAVNMQSGNFPPGADHIRFKYFDIGSPAGSQWTGNQGASGVGSGFYLVAIQETGQAAPAFHDDIYIGYSNIHNVLLIAKSQYTKNVVFEFNHTGPGFSKEGIAHQHGDGWIIRNNRFVDLNSHPNVEAGTSVIGVFGISPGSADADNWEIYGNVFAETGTYPTSHCCGTILGGERDHYLDRTYQPVSHWRVFNNVFYNMHGSDVGISLHGPDNIVYNNLYYQGSGSAGFNCKTDLCNSQRADCADSSYNPICGATWCAGSGCSGFNGSKFIGTENPFINPAAFDFRLKSSFAGVSPLDKGIDLSTLSGFDSSDPRIEPDRSRYLYDAMNTRRGQGAGWDIGAYESGVLNSAPPAPPSGLQVGP